ncbi:MAG: maltose acetyltransferase domain-containing protein, partial [Rheinheimera sp.]|nr:maltose acetyltransferase domain-containing protein [Rheinheimera sp.]
MRLFCYLQIRGQVKYRLNTGDRLWCAMLMPTEKHKMLSGDWYNPLDRELSAERLAARKLQHQFNHSAPDDEAQRRQLLTQWLPNTGK